MAPLPSASPPSTPLADSLKMKSSKDSLKASHRLETQGRTSFCSVRENDSDLAQAFTSSKVSSYAKATEAVVDEHSPTRDTAEVQFQPPPTRLHSKLHGFLYPAGSFRGWKEISVGGKAKNRSYGDLQVLNMTWNSPPSATLPISGCGPGKSHLERLPLELLRPIIDLLVEDIPPNSVTPRNMDLMALLLTSRTLHAVTLSTLYNQVTIPHSKIFRKFLKHVSENPSLGTIVRRLDFCHFNPGTIFSTARERAATRNLTSDTLLQCLGLLPNLQEFLAQEYIEDDMDADVLKKLFLGLPRLQSVDLCGCSSLKFKAAFQSILVESWPTSLPIKRLSLHKCISLHPAVFERLLPRLPALTHLDVAGTQFTDAALGSIPSSAKITHLNVAKCNRLSARSVINFLTNHPASRELAFLSLGMDARSNQLLDIEEVTELLPVLPSTLRSLNLRGSKMSSSHIELLRPLTKHLEELAVGRCLNLSDINRLFVPDETEDEAMDIDWVPHTLKYLDLTDMALSDFDFSYLFGKSSALLRNLSEPLEVIEMSDIIHQRLGKSSAAVERSGWRLNEFGSRSWVVRIPNESGHRDDGRRGWKWGASYWGMRKIPVAKADVGGMYGSFMFGRKL